MTAAELSALLVLATATSFTPGPNTTLSTALAANRGLRGAPTQPKARRAGVVPGGRNQFAESVHRSSGIAPGQQGFGPDRADVAERTRIGGGLTTLRRREGEKPIGRRDRFVVFPSSQED